MRPSPYAGPQDGWTALAERQYHLARAGCASLARLYAQAGYTCLIDDAVFPDWPAVGLDGWRELLPGLRLVFAVLLPDVEVLEPLAWTGATLAALVQQHADTTAIQQRRPPEPGNAGPPHQGVMSSHCLKPA